MLNPSLSLVVLVIFILFINSSFECKQDENPTSCFEKRRKIVYPQVFRANTSFSYPSQERHGNVTVPDPYNWLEQSIDSSKDVQSFVQQQVDLTNTFIKRCSNLDSIKQSIQANFDVYSYDDLQDWGPKDDPIYLYSVLGPNDQRKTWYLADQSQVNQAISTKFSQPIGTKFFNETLLSSSQDGAQHIVNFIISDDKKLAAYTISDGAEHTTLYIRNTSSPFISVPQNPQDNIPGGFGRWTEFLPFAGSFSLAFSPDNQGIFYDQIGYNQSTDALNSQIRYHKLGTDPKDDITLVNVDTKESANTWSFEISQDAKWLVLTAFKGIDDLTRVYLASLDQPICNKMSWLSVAPGYDYTVLYATNIQNTFYVLTSLDADFNQKMSKFTVDPKKARPVDDLRQLTDKIVMTEVIPEKQNATMNMATVIDQTILIVAYVEKARSTIYMYDLLSGQLVQQLLPGLVGTVEDLSSDSSSPQGFLTVSTFTSGRQTYQITKTDKGPAVKLWIDSKPKSLDQNAFKTEQRFATSKDGTQVSFYILYKSDFPFDGSRPAWLYFYGAYSTATLPKYDPFLLSWVSLFGGVLCIANVRGGGEFSESWHQAGILDKKQNTFDDVIAVAQHLADNKIAKRGNIIGDGRSAGGLAAMTVGNQAPEGLFGAMIPEKGPYDMLRYTQFYAGDLQIPEWGDPEVGSNFDYIFPYSPLHNVENKSYPMIILSAAAQDDRVPPLHTMKMLSELQFRHPNNVMPLLMYYFQGSGHIIGDSSRSTQIELAAVKQCLTAHCLHLKERN